MTAASSPPVARTPWLREAEVALLILLVVAGYWVRAAAFPLRGEEPRRVQVALEMIQTGDWLVPREQGQPFLSRPPLQNWLIAVSSLAFGQADAWAVRLPSLVAMLLTVLLVYGYGRTFLSPVGALAAGAAFATFPEMFTIGSQAETEMVFIFLVSGSLLVWHGGMVRGWPDRWSWLAGYTLMALASLTKGPQAPIYFGAATGSYLVLTGQWRRLFTRAHLGAGLVGAGLILAHSVPYWQAEGWASLRALWMGDTAYRFKAWDPAVVATHLAVFPLEVLGCMLPWSVLLPAYASPAFRRTIGPAWPQALFLTLCLAIAFPTIWIPPDGMTRYLSPIYPCFALMIGLVVERCAETAAPPLLAFWRRTLGLLAGVLIVAAVVWGAGSVLAAPASRLAVWIGPPVMAIIYAGVILSLAVALLRVRHGGSPARVRQAVLVLSALVIVALVGAVADARLRRSEDTPTAVARLKEMLPPDQPLVSFGLIDARFAYYYQRPIALRPWPGAADGITYFCFDNIGPGRPALPFAWEEVGAVSMDRNRQAVPHATVVVGRVRGGVADQPSVVASPAGRPVGPR